MDKKIKSTWITSYKIKEEHTSFETRQIYIWFITSDGKIVIVGKNNKFQFPGGKPEAGESREKTISRELFEEAGITVSDFSEIPNFFGYYVVENDTTNNWDGETYLQLRYILKVNKSSEEIVLSVNEREEDENQMEIAKFVDLDKLPEFIPWTDGLEEYSFILNIK